MSKKDDQPFLLLIHRGGFERIGLTTYHSILEDIKSGQHTHLFQRSDGFLDPIYLHGIEIGRGALDCARKLHRHLRHKKCQHGSWVGREIFCDGHCSSDETRVLVTAGLLSRTELEILKLQEAESLNRPNNFYQPIGIAEDSDQSEESPLRPPRFGAYELED